MSFHENLVRERKSRGLSQEELASRLRVSRQAVSKWETNDAMPDLNNLILLADTLDISLDALCGRDVPSSISPQPPAVPRRDLRFLPILCLLLAALLLIGIYLIRVQQNDPSQESAIIASVLTEEFTVSGVNFQGNHSDQLLYQFTPSLSGASFVYQITFTGSSGKSLTFDAPCNGGVCTGTAELGTNIDTYSVTVSVSDGTASRNLAVARDLSFSETASSWIPLTN